MESQKERILAYIYKRGKITNMDAFRDLQITRLSARINDLRRDGYRITTKMVAKNGKAYGEYALTEKDRRRLRCCEDCGTVYDVTRLEPMRFQADGVVQEYVNCPVCGMSELVDEFDAKAEDWKDWKDYIS